MECYSATVSTPTSSVASRNAPQRSGARQIRQSKQSKRGNNSVREQLAFAQQKYQEVLSEHINTPQHLHSKKQDEDVWAWGIFSETVLPMLLFVDDC